MGGDDSQTTTSGLNNSALNSAVTNIGSQLNNQIARGSAVFDAPMYPGISDQTRTGANSIFNNANNGSFGSSITNAINQQGDIATGRNISDPTVDAVRTRLIDDATRGVNSSFLTDGRFGSSAMLGESADAVVGALAPFDYQRQQTAISNLPTLYQASNLPGQAQVAAGQIFDADMLARRQSDADYYDRINNSGWNTLGRAGSVLSGAAGAAGTTTTQTQQTPWWQAPLQIGGALAGAFF